MKMGFVQLCILILVISGLHALKIQRTATIKGVVLPENKVKDIWVVQGRDSTEVSTEEGTFNVNVRPGTWKLIIYTTQGLRQYKELDNIETLEGKKIDLGTISLD